MTLSLRPADAHDFAFCESLSRRNMATYLAVRGIAWDPERFRSSWAQFENLVILAGPDAVGLLRLLSEDDALGLRDLQLVHERQGQGIGTWALRQAQAFAIGRGLRCVQLRVYAENPARALYARLGFAVEAVVDGTVHMAWPAPRRCAD